MAAPAACLHLPYSVAVSFSLASPLSHTQSSSAASTADHTPRLVMLATGGRAIVSRVVFTRGIASRTTCTSATHAAMVVTLSLVNSSMMPCSQFIVLLPAVSPHTSVQVIACAGRSGFYSRPPPAWWPHARQIWALGRPLSMARA